MSGPKESWHTVTPHIGDPELAPLPVNDPIAGPSYVPDAVAAQPPAKAGFFAEHRLAIVLSAVVLIILIVILYVYLTRKGGSKKKKAETPPPADAGGAPPDGVNLEELKRIRAMRQQQKAQMGAPPRLPPQNSAPPPPDPAPRTPPPDPAPRTPPPPSDPSPRTPPPPDPAPQQPVSFGFNAPSFRPDIPPEAVRAHISGGSERSAADAQNQPGEAQDSDLDNLIDSLNDEAQSMDT